MAREGLMDDSGYHGFDECNCYESCTSEVYDEAYEQGYADALDYAIKIAMERTPQIIYSVELERLKEKQMGYIEQIEVGNIYITDVNDWFATLSNLNSECKNYTDSEIRYKEIVAEHDKKIRADFIDKFIKRTQLRQMTKAECINTMYVLADELKEQK